MLAACVTLSSIAFGLLHLAEPSSPEKYIGESSRALPSAAHGDPSLLWLNVLHVTKDSVVFEGHTLWSRQGQVAKRLEILERTVEDRLHELRERYGCTLGGMYDTPNDPRWSVILSVERDVPFEVLRTVLSGARLANYTGIRLAVTEATTAEVTRQR